MNGDARSSKAQPRFRFADSESAMGREKVWIDPDGLQDVFEAMKTYQGTTEVKLVVGNTAAGYYKDIRPNVFIDVSKVNITSRFFNMALFHLILYFEPNLTTLLSTCKQYGLCCEILKSKKTKSACFLFLIYPSG